MELVGAPGLYYQTHPRGDLIQMKHSLIALALACAMAFAAAEQLPPDVSVASMKMDALSSGVRVESFTLTELQPCGSPMPAKAGKGGLARDSP